MITAILRTTRFIIKAFIFSSYSNLKIFFPIIVDVLKNIKNLSQYYFPFLLLKGVFYILFGKRPALLFLFYWDRLPFSLVFLIKYAT